MILSGKPGTKGLTHYLTPVGAWALAFGCRVGWGAFVMPGTTFLPVAGPWGTVAGIAIGALIMLILSMNYHYLMNRHAHAGGAYDYAKNSFGYDHGFLNDWFLLLTYIAIIWANATALPLIARQLFSSLFQFGWHYEIAGYHIYMGEVLLAVASLVFTALVCLRNKRAARTQILMAFLLIGGIAVCIGFALGSPRSGLGQISPAFSPDTSPLTGILTIVALAPWAYVGFESISHSAGEADFSLKKSFRIMTAAVIAAAVAYASLAVLAACVLPEGCASWTEYIVHLGSYEGVRGLPTFYFAETVIIVLTGYSWDDMQDEAMAAGVDGIMSKPLFTGSLLQEICKVLDRRAAASAEGPAPAPEENEETESDTLEGRRVLIAEDMEINAEILMDLLDMEGISADRAENGQEAVEMFAAKPEGYYDAVLMDVRMPVMDGLEATRAIREIDRQDARQIPIIAMTANAFDEDVQRSLQAGMSAHLSKPVEPEKLYETLKRLIHAGR